MLSTYLLPWNVSENIGLNNLIPASHFAATFSFTYKTEGSLIVLALARQLRALKKEVDALELMRRVQNDVVKNYISADVRQTPQVSFFQHRPVYFRARQVKLFVFGVFYRLLYFPGWL
jgi:hypothetical protein